MIEDNGRFFSASPASGKLCETLGKTNFNPAEPRDRRGWWSSAEDDADSALGSTIAYRGYYHDFVVDDFLSTLDYCASIGLKVP